MIGIYKITSPSKKIYIGQSIDIKKRWLKHKTSVVKSKLYNSFLKYGVENHIFEVIEECSIQSLNERERYYQDLFNVLEIGLNLKLTNTFDKSGLLSQDTKDKISKRKRSVEEIEKSKLSRTGLKRTEEQKMKIKLSRNYHILTENHKAKIGISNKGIYPTKEARLKMSKAKTKRSLKYILNTESGVFHLGVNEACFSYNISKGILSKMLSGFRTNKTNLKYV
jgi:group I intron endonuclease